MKTRPGPIVVLLVLLSYVTMTLSGCVTKYVFERRQEREARVKEKTNFWSLSAVTSAQIVSGVLLVYVPPAAGGGVGVAGAFEPGSEWLNPYTLLVVPALATDTAMVTMAILIVAGAHSRR